jgi:glutamate 5-kinase
MATKLKAAAMVTQAGIFSLVGDGFDQRLSEVIKNPSAATLFLPKDRRMPSRSRWIAFTGQSYGSVSVDDGAAKALCEKGKSLLPAGIKKVKGTFKAGEMIDIQTSGGSLIARGLTNYSADEISAISGCKSAEIPLKLGQKRFDEVVHRNNLVLV